ncbi:hypothetical protein BU23DRAFT_83244 [Bimuria novae-zelandiae CBS 107.79]|uniref:Glycoside hydrolase family 31 protein n=1 Tax=Bimuria novae-zelandiae CBS 107.79 TaxID=1447943 RepID=A0A6A5VE14_9PLEO|nr:hypothetical protein BU23DRAFT_83244 [Bimuria novae-zelandiae CBS 107.79]
MVRLSWLSLSALLPFVFCEYKIALTPSSGLLITEGNKTIVNNTAILAGAHNTTVSALRNTAQGLTYAFLTPTVAKITLNTSNVFHGARFSASETTRFYGVWEYPFNNRIDNANISFDLKGVGNNVGINWCNARAPFFLTSTGYGVYADTLKMGSYDFTHPGDAQFIFNSSSLVYYIILPKDEGGLKSIIEQYTELSARSEIPPTSGLGPTFWSDDFTMDFHGSVSNAQENIRDVVNHLYDNRIRATSIFADRPYGSGNRSWGNFDFDPIQYPDPVAFIQNLTDVSGIDFQVWIANRAQAGTKIYNASKTDNWLFPDDHPLGGLGEALNLSIPSAYNYFDESLKYFASVGVKGYKIDRGEEGEMPDYVQNEQMALFLDLAYDSMVGTWGKSLFYNFARSAVDRSRAKTHVWNGDSHANFTGLAYSVSSGIRSGLISFGIWGSDTGGYTREGVSTPSPEVWARWMWFSAFSPVYELMLGTNHTPWYPPYDNTSTLAVMKQTANLHADLLPYIRSYTNDVSKTGRPIIRALFLEAEKDEKTWDINDSYFFGSELLVAPVVSAGGSRSVYFPVGPSKSYLEYFNKRQIYPAGTTVNITSPLTSIPVFVKQGAIIPRGDIYQGNAKWIEGWTPDLRLELYPSFDVPESRFTYYGGGAENEIILRTNKADRSATVDTGSLELNGWGVKLIWYLKGAEDGKVMATKKRSQGGLVTVTNIETLF